MLVLGLIYATLKVLDSYTHHGEALSVPDFTGMTLEEVESLCNEKLIRFSLIDSVYTDSVAGSFAKPGTVVDQSPGPGFKVKENRTIFITIKAFFPERVSMPQVVGVSLRQATATLETYGLRIGTLTYVPDLATNYVLQQMYKGDTIATGTRIKKWSTIDLVVGRSTNVKSIVPQILGLKYAKAEEKIKEYGFNLGFASFDETVVTAADSQAAKVYRQRPVSHPEVLVRLGTPIDIFLTRDSVIIQSVDTIRRDTVNIELDIE